MAPPVVVSAAVVRRVPAAPLAPVPVVRRVQAKLLAPVEEERPEPQVLDVKPVLVVEPVQPEVPQQAVVQQEELAVVLLEVQQEQAVLELETVARQDQVVEFLQAD